VEVPAEGAATVEDARLSPAAAPLVEGRGELTALALWLLVERAEVRAFMRLLDRAVMVWRGGSSGSDPSRRGSVRVGFAAGTGPTRYQDAICVCVWLLPLGGRFSHRRHAAGMRMLRPGSIRPL